MIAILSALPEVQASAEKRSFLRRLQLGGPQGGQAIVDGRRVVMLGSNNYLGLANHPKVVERARQALETYGCGTAMNPTLCTTPIHEALAEATAAFAGAEAALLFNSCTAANIALVMSLMGPDDVVFSDQFNHASIIDACRSSKAPTRVYRHRDCAALSEALSETEGARLRLIISDGVFSMEGDTAPLPEMLKLAERHRAVVAIDESHAAGVIGPRGRGTAAYYGVGGKVDIQTGTYSKAFGAAGGGYVAGSRALIDFLYDHARFFIFTSAMSPVSAACAVAALEVHSEEPGLVDRLWANTRRLRQGLEQLGFRLLGGESPITPIVIGDELTADRMGARLLEEGVYVPALGYPVVPRGEARLRAQPSAAHTVSDIDQALVALERVGREAGVI